MYVSISSFSRNRLLRFESPSVFSSPEFQNSMFVFRRHSQAQKPFKSHKCFSRKTRKNSTFLNFHENDAKRIILQLQIIEYIDLFRKR